MLFWCKKERYIGCNNKCQRKRFCNIYKASKSKDKKCADVLSVLDNCFFAIYKGKWYEELIFVNDVDKKAERAINLFNSLIGILVGKRMYSRCGYDPFFDPKLESDEDIDDLIDRNKKEDEK